MKMYQERTGQKMIPGTGKLLGVMRGKNFILHAPVKMIS